MEIKRDGVQLWAKGPAQPFPGSARIDTPFHAKGPARLGGAIVTFESGPCTVWRTGPLGQTLIVTAGCGWTQCEDRPIIEIPAGDVIWRPSDHRPWHGATPTKAVTHIAINEALDGRMVDWMGHVTDERDLAGPPCAQPQ